MFQLQDGELGDQAGRWQEERHRGEVFNRKKNRWFWDGNTWVHMHMEVYMGKYLKYTLQKMFWILYGYIEFWYSLENIVTFDFLDLVYDMCLLWLYHFYAYEQFMMFFFPKAM